MSRLPDRVKHQFKEILESPTGYAKFKRIMAATKKEETYLAYFKECMDRTEGKAPQFIGMDVNDVTRPNREQLESALARINGRNGNQNGVGLDKAE